MSLRKEQLAHPALDEFWQTLIPELERIEVPALVCASFSDQGLHTRGSFEAFRRISSKHRFLFTHRGGKWSTYYSKEALERQARFFDRFLKDDANGIESTPPVRLEVRDRGNHVHEVRDEPVWPLVGTRWTPLYLAPGSLRRDAGVSATASFDVPAGRASFAIDIEEDLEIVGPMKLILHIELRATTDAHLFACVRKLVRGRHVPFEGSYGFGRDVLTKGWLRVAHRRAEFSSQEWRVVRQYDREEPLPMGEIARVEMELLPSATLFRRGETLRLDVQGHWFWRRNPFFGMFPGSYAPSPKGESILHLGGDCDAQLLVPLTGRTTGV